MASNVQQGSNPASNPMTLSNDVLHLAIANKLIRYLLTKGQHTEALFLTPANEGEVNQMRRKIKQDREAIDISAHTKNPHVIAELLIEVLSSWVSQPLLTYALYDSFILTADFTRLNDRLTAQHTLCDSLPSYFKATVKQCLALLLKVTENAPLTRVTLDKLAPIFSPILLRPKKVEPYMAEQDEQKVKRLFLEMVGYHEVIIPQQVPGEAAPRSPLFENEEQIHYESPRVIDMGSLHTIRRYKTAAKQYFEFFVKANPTWSEVSDSPAVSREEDKAVHEQKSRVPEISIKGPAVPENESSVNNEAAPRVDEALLEEDKLLNASQDAEVSHEGEQHAPVTAVNDDSNDEIFVQDEEVIVSEQKPVEHHAHAELIADSIDRITKFVSEEQHKEKQHALSSLSGSEVEDTPANENTDDNNNNNNNNNNYNKNDDGTASTLSNEVNANVTNDAVESAADQQQSDVNN
jgi:hypothetical protein